MTCSRGCCPSSADHYRSVALAPFIAAANKKDQALSRDLAAYKSLTDNGLEPKKIDGCAELVARDAPAHVIEGTLPPLPVEVT